MRFIFKGAVIILLNLFLFNPVFSQVGDFESNTDVGNVKLPGSSNYNSEVQSYELTGAGENIWNKEDQFQFLYKKLKGDFILRAHVQFIDEGVDPHRKIGWMVRKSLDTDAAHVSSVVHGDGLTSLQYRKVQGDETMEKQSNIISPDVIQLERKGDSYILSAAKHGELFTSTEISDLTIGDEVFVGLFICSHNKNAKEKAVFSNVRIVLPDNHQPKNESLGSHLEIMDIESGHREILYRYNASLQAPNWTIDGKALIYNQKGTLYRFDLKTKNPKPIDTGVAKNNNNDHVISFDGKQLAISDHTENPYGGSWIYTVPVEGGTATRITENAPSYLHGWSPDAKDLVFCGEREGNFDVYRINIESKIEERLTDAPGLDDGPEYSPDGKYIYFNSNRSGTMQLYRMNPDGTEQKQLTFDAHNDWFPHISPDGKWIAFLSFQPDIDPGSHPFYKRVYLRLMPADLSSKPKVIAYLYGGQGTMNVPSWSPDSKKIAFVSNTLMK
ncbi:DUF5050 domain-containing protein [Sunxiuqinia sp. A32]|uniref:DUF5050 domain-containing protein n=1 Tax=Sunxiuqinia sp. A32 TaxID=3461496 RepID=UPI00404627AB